MASLCGKKAPDSGSNLAVAKKEKKPRRKSGFSSPLHPLQIATWVLFLLLTLHFFAFLLPLLQRILREKFDNEDTSTSVQVFSFHNRNIEMKIYDNF